MCVWVLLPLLLIYIWQAKVPRATCRNVHRVTLSTCSSSEVSCRRQINFTFHLLCRHTHTQTHMFTHWQTGSVLHMLHRTVNKKEERANNKDGSAYLHYHLCSHVCVCVYTLNGGKHEEHGAMRRNASQQVKLSKSHIPTYVSRYLVSSSNLLQ